jgi:hypothetical protein
MLPMKFFLAHLNLQAHPDVRLSMGPNRVSTLSLAVGESATLTFVLEDGMRHTISLPRRDDEGEGDAHRPTECPTCGAPIDVP